MDVWATCSPHEADYMAADDMDFYLYILWYFSENFCIRNSLQHAYIIKWKYFPCYWPFVWGIQWWPLNSRHKGQWRGALMIFSSISAWTNSWENNQHTGDLRCHHAHYDITVMKCCYFVFDISLLCRITDHKLTNPPKSLGLQYYILNGKILWYF